jgi:hypothetical protein
MDITPRKGDIIVALKEQTSITVILFILLETANLVFKGKTGFVSPKLMGKYGRKCQTTHRTDKLLIIKIIICPDKTSKNLQSSWLCSD